MIEDRRLGRRAPFQFIKASKRTTILLAIATAISGVVPFLPSATARATGTASVVVNDQKSLGAVNRNLFGTNYPIFMLGRHVSLTARQPWPTVTSAALTLGLRFVRMAPAVNLQACGGTDCTYHWWSTVPGAPEYSNDHHGWQLMPDEWVQNVTQITGGTGVPMPIVNVEAGTAAEAQDWVAYMNGSTSSLQVLSDGTTVGRWAGLRAANGHPTPYGIHYWEIGNEEYGLHPCTTWSSKNGAGCVNHNPPECVGLKDDALYGCLVRVFGRLMKQVDSSIAVVAGYMGQAGDFAPVKSRAGAYVDAIDIHQYAEAKIDPYGTTFDTDGQSAQYPISVTTQKNMQVVTFTLWIASNAQAHVDAYLDSAALPVEQFTVYQSGDFPIPYTVKKKEVVAGDHSHTLRIVACSASSVNFYSKRCESDGGHPLIQVRDLTQTIGDVYPHQMTVNRTCFSGVSGLQNLNGPTPTTLVDTRVSTTVGSTGDSIDPGAPWRIAANDDFPVTFAAAAPRIFSKGFGEWPGKLAGYRCGSVR